MEGTNSESQPKNQLEFSTTAELERAKNGVEEFRKNFQSNGLRGRRILRSGEIGPAVQSMFLGLKPMSYFFGREMDEVKKVRLPEKFRLNRNHLYDRELVKEVITKNPDIFDDFSELDEDVDQYMEAFLAKKPETAEEDHKHTMQVGLLYGYPKDAVQSYAKNIGRYESVTNYLRKMAFFFALGPMSNLTDQEKDIYLHLALFDKSGEIILTPGYLHDFLDKYEEAAREFLENNPIDSPPLKMTEEEIDFMVKNRPVNVHGFQYGSGVPTQETSNFPKKVEELYEKSGMNQFLSRSRFLVYF